jgi:hypothetical protein
VVVNSAVVVPGGAVERTSFAPTQTVWMTSTVSTTSSNTVYHTISFLFNGAAVTNVRRGHRAKDKILEAFMIAIEVYADVSTADVLRSCDDPFR